MKRVGVVGGGLGGLAAASTLAARGHSVVLFERNEWLGGKAAVLEQDGFRFDMGPTILTLPIVLKRIFAVFKHRLALALGARFVMTFAKSKKIMPAGMMAVLSVVGIVVTALALAMPG